MQREPALAPPGKVVHVVGRVTDEVFSFLGPATQALARSGREQAVVMIDELDFRHHAASLHSSAELVMAPSLRNPFSQWSAVRHACRAAFTGPLHAVHLHGVLPALAGAQAIRAARADVPVFFSPHASRSIGTLGHLGKFALALARPAFGIRRGSAIVNVPHETRAFQHWKSTELVESPVGGVFFEAARREARHPLIVTGGRTQSMRNAELLAQLAVLLGGEDLRIGFNWIGSVDKVSRVRLGAAGVSVFDVTSDAECSDRLATGWIYVAPGPTRGFPLFLAEAMAAGLPCVAFDCVQHREIIRDGETGYLCRSERDMIERIAQLVDNEGLRSSMGEAARAEARSRFGESEFGVKLLAAYAMPE
ncbi:MAG: glycosyltransferase, partial [Burkholderiaceae bacterium]